MCELPLFSPVAEVTVVWRDLAVERFLLLGFGGQGAGNCYRRKSRSRGTLRQPVEQKVKEVDSIVKLSKNVRDRNWELI